MTNFKLTCVLWSKTLFNKFQLICKIRT